MKDFHLAPFEWRRLSRFDRLMLNYQRVVEQYYEIKAIAKRKQEIEGDRRREDFLASLPKVARR